MAKCKALTGSAVKWLKISLDIDVLCACKVGRGWIQSLNGLQVDKFPQSTSQLLATWRRCAVLLQRTLRVFYIHHNIPQLKLTVNAYCFVLFF